MFRHSTIQLLRFQFSFFLFPVFLFALSQLDEIDLKNAILVFFILHFLVYPSSNGYNSYMDRDTTPIGGLEKPVQPTRELFRVTILMDILAIILSSFLGIYFTLGIILYIMASRAYSYRRIRLKKYPVIGYLLVIVFQGALVFFLTFHGSSINRTRDVPVLPMLAALCLIGGYYPLTQVYQHAEDRKDGVKTLSYILGKKGTFIFCGIVFATATLCMYLTFMHKETMEWFWVFAVCMSPVLLFFTRWMFLVWKDEKNANFHFSMKMNILAATFTTICFCILIVMNHFE